jgi:aminopeptidase N
MAGSNNQFKMAKKILLLFVLFVQSMASQAQSTYTLDDTLRGSITPERAWWDLTYYNLRLRVNPADSSIQGSNTVQYKVLSGSNLMQIDLQPPLRITSVTQDGQVLNFTKRGKNAYFVELRKEQPVGTMQAITVSFGGKPRAAKNAPWDGGFSWKKDKKGNPFVATSCQGLGASVWWPCKDHMYDEPDSQSVAVTVPSGLTDVSNGRLRRSTDNGDGTTTFEWFVKNPINNYGINVNVAQYSHWSDTLHGEKGVLDLNYYVLTDNLTKAKAQFQQVKPMLRAFEYWFGAYPFYEDGYKLVEVPYLGMEHQSSVTYGNGYRNGYLGMDLSRTGWGLKWDFIIVHESGHEWFANNITYRDIADMWIHESFTNYSEGLYTEYMFGKEAGAEYMRGLRKGIDNRHPIITTYDVNQEPFDSDQYNKGGNMLHTIRQIIGDDEKWRSILRGLNRDFYHQTVTTQQIEQYISQKAGMDLSKVFDQYLRSAEIPTLEYRMGKKKVEYRWINCVAGFDMPIKVQLEKDKWQVIKPTTGWQTARHKLSKSKKFAVNDDYYVFTKESM